MVQYERNRNADSWLELEEAEALRHKLVEAGIRWTHTCPTCGRTFENDAPEKGYLCKECSEKEIERLKWEWE